MCGRIAIVSGLLFGLWISAAAGQSPAKSDALSISVLQKRIKAIQDNPDPANPSQEKVLQFLTEGVERLEIAQENLERAKHFERSLRQVADSLKTTSDRLAKIPKAADPSIVDIDDLHELDQMVEQLTKQLDDANDGLRERQARLETEAAQRRVRPEELIKEIAALEDRFREIDDELEELPNSGESRELQQAHQIFLLARQQRAETEQRALLAETEWLQSPESSELLQLQRELAARELSLKLSELDLLQTELAQRRGSEADQRVWIAERVVAQSRSELKSLAETNLELARERHDVTDKLQELEERHTEANTSLLELEKEFERTQQMVKDIGLTDSIGLLLRQQRVKLQNPRRLRSSLMHRNDVVREARMRLFQLDAEQVTLIDLDAAAGKSALEVTPESQRKGLLPGVKQLLSDRRQLIKGLDGDYTKYFQRLVDLDNVERRLLDLTTKYADYVDERVFWIRTGQAFGSEQLSKVVPSTGWLREVSAWQSVLDAARTNIGRGPLAWGLSGLLFLAWFSFRPVMKGLLQRRGVQAAHLHRTDLSPTLQSIGLTVAIACGWPYLLWFIGWRLEYSASSLPFVHAVAAGLMRAATFAFPLEVLRIVCIRGGLAEEHFDWHERLVTIWRRNLSWFIPFGSVLVFLIGMVEGSGDEHRLDSLGRLLFLAFASISTLFCRLAFRRLAPLESASEASNPVPAEEDHWSERFWRFVPSLMLLVSFCLFGLGWSGYFYTAIQLMWRLQRTTWLLVGLLLIRATVLRWIALERRRMAVLQDVELQTIAEAGRAPGNLGHNPFLFPRWTWPDFRLNLTQIVTQIRSLLDTGMIALLVAGVWIVWADVTPALNILDQKVLWNTSVEVMVTSGDGQLDPAGKMVKRMLPVTAADLSLAMLVFGIAWIAGRNIPGLVEVILHEQLAVDAGARFAATCLVRYFIFVAGICLAFAQIRVGWNNVQWLVAAASVGLGFGLQEIFANFVSGIILLFERPMRVGDVITVGDTTGTVSRIRFRATTIVDGDRKELIVPNKEFITGKLLNWTLSDQVNRFSIKVVVGPNNDPQLIRRILLETAARHPSLLKDPAPAATLEEINGGLTFILRAFLPRLDGRTGIINDLYTTIHSRFEAENVEMPYPAHQFFVRKDDPAGHPASPPAPHQPPSGVPFKKW